MNCTRRDMWRTTRRGWAWIVIAGIAISSATHAQDPSFTQTLPPSQAALSPLVGTDTLVTVVLKAGGARDSNLRIVDAAATYFAFQTSNGERQAYPYDLVQEIRVQSNRIDTRRFVLSSGLSLRGVEQEVISRAIQRTRELFQSANDNQSVKMNAAAVMASDGDEAGRTYLRQLAATNNLDVALEAAKYLYLAGDGDSVDPVLAERGLVSGNRKHRTAAAQLAGLLEITSTIPSLRTMAADRSADLSAPAIRALGRLNDSSSIPMMLSALAGLSDERGEAAVGALVSIGGPEVIEGVKRSMENAKGLIWLRHARVLFKLDDASGEQGLKNRAMSTPGFDREAAILLAVTGDWDASEYLRRLMTERNDPNQENLIYKARAAAALAEAGYPPAVSELSRLLRIQETDVLALGTDAEQVKPRIVKAVRIFTANRIAQLGYPNLMTILQPPIESIDPETALAACEAANAIADSSFRDRLVQLNEW